MMHQELVLGVDGGGSKTVAWLARCVDQASRPVGSGHAGPSNVRTQGFATAAQNIEQAVARAFGSLGLPRGSVAGACLAIAGFGTDSNRQRLEHWAHGCALADRIQVVNDALPAVFAGTTDGVGVALISGTGSLACGRTADGKSARCGGWGPLMGDEGSGYALGRAALQAAASCADGRAAATSLLDRLQAALGVASAVELKSAVYAPDFCQSDVASLAPLVFDASNAGDAVAKEIIDRAAVELCRLVTSVARKLELEQPELALAGSLLVHQRLLREQIVRLLRVNGLCPPRVTAVADPVAGTVILARRLL